MFRTIVIALDGSDFAPAHAWQAGGAERRASLIPC
jgi:hypothetical protein